LLAKRLYGKYLTPESKEVTTRITEIQDNKYDEEYDELMLLDVEELKKRYYARDIE